MPRCNGCGRDRLPSKEHLVHLAVGRALLSDRSLTDARVMRQQLEKKTYLQVAKNAGSEGWGRLVRADMSIRNLLCEECNGGWARRLEEEAGKHLFGFLNENEPMDHNLLSRWIRFFGLKYAVYYRRNEWLREKERPLLNQFADPGWVPDGPLFMGELADRPTTLLGLLANHQDAALWRGMMIITQAVVWLLPFTDFPPRGMVVSEPRNGSRRSQLPPILVAQVYDAVAPVEAMQEMAKLWPKVARDRLKKSRTAAS